jgi:hypothetical protein
MNDTYQDIRKAALIRLRRAASTTDDDIRNIIVAAAAFLQDDESGSPIDVEAMLADLRSTLDITSEQHRILQNPDSYRPWLRDARAGITWNFWSRYREYLRSEEDLPPDTVNQLDRITDDVLDRLFNPALPLAQDRRGMVVGHVQSGKTGNYTGLVCKAVDAGFRMIIILTGRTSDLRSQTQFRLDKGFIGWETQSGGLNSTRVTDHYIGVGADDKTRGPAYTLYTLTSSSLTGDFKASEAKRNGIDVNGAIPVIAVVKKDGRILSNLISWLAARGTPRTGAPGFRLNNMPALIIDDEADNASVNTKAERDESTAINARIRTLLMLFDQRAYVGYTATPFANIYISLLSDAEAEAMIPLQVRGASLPLGQDLFPSDFIINIPAPSNYIGPHRMFGMTDNDDGVLPVFVPVTDYAASIPDRHQNGGRRPTFLPDSLHRAVKFFLLSCAIRRARGQEGQHNSMLVHVSRYQRWQNHIAEMLAEVLRGYQEQIQLNAPAFMSELREIWETEYRDTTEAIRKMEGLYHDPRIVTHTWEQIEPYLHAAAARVEVRAVHGQTRAGSDPLLQPLDYAEADRRGEVLSIIAVGGDKLSRGFTLVGLSISYYLRATRMYDTLMQMGRWFGYRSGYVDLCRIFTTPDLASWYRHITLAMEEMRSQFDLMAMLKRTPRDYGLRVRTLPGILQITAANKRRTGQEMDLSYSGTTAETYVFSLDPVEILDNLNAGRRLIEQIGAPITIGTQPWCWHHVDTELVLDFLNDYKSHQANLIRNLLIQYISAQQPNGNLTEWTIILATTKRTDATPAIFMINGREEEVNPLLRTEAEDKLAEYKLKNARLLDPSHESLDILDLEPETYEEILAITRANKKPSSKKTPEWPTGVLTKKERPRNRGVLLLYPLDPRGTRAASDTPILGYAISFPVLTNDRKVPYLVTEQFFRNPELGTGLEEEED